MTTGSPGDWIDILDEGRDAWIEAMNRLTRAQDVLLERIAALRDVELETQVAGWPWTYRLMIHGTLHHDLYHAGQIALMKRQWGSSSEHR